MKIEMNFKNATKIVSIIENEQRNCLSELNYYKEKFNEAKKEDVDTSYYEEQITLYNERAKEYVELLKPFYEM